MSICATRRAVWKSRLAIALFLAIFIGLFLSGRAWQGPLYPFPMLFIAFSYALALLGYILANSMLPRKKTPAKRNIWDRRYPFVEWPMLIICIIGQFWWGWYLVLAILFRGLLDRAAPDSPIQKGALGIALKILEFVFIIYILFSKHFFFR